MAVVGEGEKKRHTEDDRQAWKDDDYIHADNDDGSCDDTCKMREMDRDTASTRGDEAHCPVEAPMSEE